jgi:isopenicillin N synthase-like dioxygenase
MITAGSDIKDSGGEGDGEERMCKDRYSIPFFATPNSDTVIECLPGCWGEGREKRYDAITAGDYITMRMEALY